MVKDIFNYFQIASKLALKRSDERTFFHGSIAIRKDGKLVSSSNGASRFPTQTAHSEVRLCRKIDVGSVVYVVRIRKNGELAYSRPCANCERTMRSHGVKKVYYSINDSEYGVINLMRN